MHILSRDERKATLVLLIIGLFVFLGATLLYDTNFQNISSASEKKESYTKVYTTSYPENAQKKIRWMIAHAPETYFLEAATTFKNIIEQESGGTITVEISTFDDTVSESEQDDFRATAIEKLRLGETDMMQTYISDGLTEIESKLMVLELPRLFRDYEHINRVVEGEIGEELLSGLEGSEFTGLAFTFSGGFVSFFSKDPSVTNLDSLKGRETPQESGGLLGKRFHEILGMKLTDKESINRETHVSRAIYTDFFGNNDYYTEDREQQSFLHSNHAVLFTVLVMNSDFFNSLTPEEQSIVTRAAKIAAQKERKEIESDEYRFMASDRNRWVHTLSSKDERRLDEIREQLVSEFSEYFSPALVERIKNL